MKKIFVVLALMSMIMMTVGCGCRQTATETVVDETEVVIDTALETFEAADTTLVVEAE